MPEVTAVVRNGQIKLPTDIQLPDGLHVRVLWDEAEQVLTPYEREALTEEDVRADLAWATGKRFQP